MAEKLKRAGYPQISELAGALAEFALLNALPVWFGQSPFRVANPIFRNATVSLVKLGESYLAVTCDHVLREYEKFCLEEPTALFGILSTPIDVGSYIRERHEALDLAILDVTTYVASERLPRDRFHVPVTWPPADVSTSDVIGLAGYPGAWREQTDIAHFRFFTFSSGAGKVESVGPEHLVTRFELEECVMAASDGKVIGDLGGLSGGPVWAWRNVHAELVGFVTQYSRDCDLLYVRRASVLDADGRIAKGAGVSVMPRSETEKG